jgi:hypothetical protein
LAKNEVILGVDCDRDGDDSAFSCFFFFLRGEEGEGKEDGVTDCCDQDKK